GSEKVDREQFTHDMDRLLRQYYGTSLRESRMGQVLTQAIQLSARRGLRLPSGLVLLIKVLLQVEGLGQLLDPDYNFESEAGGFLEESLRGEFSYSEMRQQGIEAVLRWKRLLTEFPSRIRDIIDRAARGSLRIPV